MVEEKKKKANNVNNNNNNTQTVWFSLKKSLHCKSDASDVHNPTTTAKTRKKQQLTSILTKKTTTSRSGCSRSLANLKDVIQHGSKRHNHHHLSERPPTSNCSPRSIGSSEFLNPIAHEVILSNSKCELRITGFNNGDSNSVVNGYVGTLKPGTPMHCFSNPSFKSCTANNTPPRKNVSNNSNGSFVLGERNGFSSSERRAPFGKDGGNNNTGVTCHKCGELFVKWEALESHHLSKHAVTELTEGDSSRKIVEIICRSTYLKPDNHHSVRIDRVLKVHNMQKTLARFEDYRETVKIKASKLPKKHPRCLADGNELLRFYGTTLACSLGLNGSSNLCISDKCCVCRIIRHGFSTKRELKEGVGVFTTSTSGRAYESIEMCEGGDGSKKALIVCRVIAGRVHRPLENIKDVVGQSGFDSLAGKVGLYSNIEELYLLNPKALLPCFVVICKS